MQSRKRTAPILLPYPELSEKYAHLSDDARTMKDYGVLLFHRLLQIKIRFLRYDETKHIYSVQTYKLQVSDDLDISHYGCVDYLLRVEYNTTVNKLYSMVADHYKISVEHVVLMMNDFKIVSSDTQLHVLFYPPIIWPIVNYAFLSALLSGFAHCPDPAQCKLAKKINDDLIIKELVSVRGDSWEVIVKVFNFSDEIKKEIEDNSEDDHIRCVDVMHRMYHHDDDLTWEFVEIQVRKEDPQLADAIRTHL